MSTETVDRTAKTNYMGGTTSWVLTRDDLFHLIEQMRSAWCVVMDLETTGLDEHAVSGGQSNGGVAARVSLASITLPQQDRETGGWDGAKPVTYVLPLSHPRSPFLGEWRKVLRLVARAMVKFKSRFVNHHAKFDSRYVYATTGIDLAPLIRWDTQMSSHLLDETQPSALKETAAVTFGIPRWDEFDLSYPGASEDVDLWLLGEYAAMDTYWTFRLMLNHLERMFLSGDGGESEDWPETADEVADARIGQVAEIVSMPTARSLAHMEQTGIQLDTEYVKRRLQEERQRSEESLDWLAERYNLSRGDASTASSSKWFQSLTDRAIEEGELRLMSMTRNGNPQWTKHIIGKQARRGSKTAEVILAQRDSQKQAEFLSSWLEKQAPDGRIYSTFRAASVRSGRLSSSNPNLQQIARSLRPAFIPRPGYLIADLDHSQLELRVIAYISRSQPMLDALNAGQDLHSLLAADIQTRKRWQTDPKAPPVRLDEVTSAQRKEAKSANFGLAYMQGRDGFINYSDSVFGVEFSEAEADEVIDGYFTTWDGIRDWHTRTIATAARLGYVTSPIGRRRLLPAIRSSNEYLRSEAEKQAVNSPVQGFGADIMQLGMASIYGELPGTKPVAGCIPVATVHDSLVAEIREDDWESIVAECQQRMEGVAPSLARLGVELDVPLVADASVGHRWGEYDVTGD